jgi:hypothetical protein
MVMRMFSKKAFIGSAAALALGLATVAFTAPVSAGPFVHGGGGGHIGGGGAFHGSSGFQGGGMFHGGGAFQGGGMFHGSNSFQSGTFHNNAFAPNAMVRPNAAVGSSIAGGFGRDHDRHHHNRRFFAGGPFYDFDYGNDCAPYWNGYRYVYPYANGYSCGWSYGATY